MWWHGRLQHVVLSRLSSSRLLQRLYVVGAPVDPAILSRFSIGTARCCSSSGALLPPLLQRAGTAPSGLLLAATAAAGGKRRRGSPGPEPLRSSAAAASSGASSASLEAELAASRASESNLAQALQVLWTDAMGMIFQYKPSS